MASKTDRKKPKVFISYAHEDVDKAADLAARLQSAGADPWLDKHKLVLGDNWEAEIKRAVADADAFVVCLRTGFDAIGFRQKEVRWAIEALQMRPPGGAFIIPFLLEPCDLPEWCRPYHAGDTDRPTEFNDLVRAIEKHCRVKLDVQRANEVAGLISQLGSQQETHVVEALSQYGEAAVSSLRESLMDKDSHVRANAIAALSKMGPRARDAVPDLIASLQDENYDVRASAAKALGEIFSTARK